MKDFLERMLIIGAVTGSLMFFAYAFFGVTSGIEGYISNLASNEKKCQVLGKLITSIPKLKYVEATGKLYEKDIMLEKKDWRFNFRCVCRSISGGYENTMCRVSAETINSEFEDIINPNWILEVKDK